MKRKVKLKMMISEKKKVKKINIKNQFLFLNIY